MGVYTYSGNLREQDQTTEVVVPSTKQTMPLGGYAELTYEDRIWLSQFILLKPGKTGYDRSLAGRRSSLHVQVDDQSPAEKLVNPNPRRRSLTIQSTGSDVYLGGSSVDATNYEYMIVDGATITVVDDPSDFYAAAVSGSTTLFGVEISR